jgi:hypothetical protein
MASRFSATVFGVALAAATGVIVATVVSTAPTWAAQQPAAQAGAAGQGRGPAQPPAPCGPQAQLPATLSKNVDSKSRCFELRIYTVDQTKAAAANVGINELHQRFREQEVAIFQKHGAEIVGVWQQMNNPDTLVWMLAYRDRAHRDEVWAKFNADPDWKTLRTKYPVPVSANTFMMSASDYSPMK